TFAFLVSMPSHPAKGGDRQCYLQVVHNRENSLPEVLSSRLLRFVRQSKRANSLRGLGHNDAYRTRKRLALQCSPSSFLQPPACFFLTVDVSFARANQEFAGNQRRKAGWVWVASVQRSASSKRAPSGTHLRVSRSNTKLRSADMRCITLAMSTTS